MSFGYNHSVSIAMYTKSKASCNDSNLNISCSSSKVEKDVLWYTTSILLILIIILEILGNSTVLAVTWIERKLHQPNKYFVACLAVADLLVGVSTCPLSLYQHLRTGGVTSIHLCQLWIWNDQAAETVSIYTLTFISFDRCLKMSKSFRYNSLMTTSKSL